MSLHLKDVATVEFDDTEVDAVEALLPAPTSQAVAVHDATTSVVPEAAPASVLDQAIRLASIQGIDKDMFDRIMAANERETALQAEERFNDAMNAAQRAIAPVARTSENKQVGNWFAKLEAVDAAIRPIYIEHGFNVSYNTVPPLVAGNIRVECEVALGRFSKKYYREAAADTIGPKGNPTKTALHGGASTETYLKRYLVCGAFNVVFRNLDDDGNAGGMTFLTEDEQGKIGALIGETGTDPAAFFAIMLTEEVHTLADIPRVHFDRLMLALKRKHGRKEAS